MALDYYIDPVSGNDANDGLTPLTAFQTVGAAEQSTEWFLGTKEIYDDVTWHLAAGNYPGFILSNWSLRANVQSSLKIVGEMVTPTLTSGTASGTVTSVTPGAFTNTNFSVLNDTTQSWTTDELRGKYLNITGGPAAGLCVPIISNTATSMTLCAATFGATSPTTSSTYSITDCGSVITTPVDMNIGLSTTPVTKVGIGIVNFFAQAVGVGLQLENLKVHLTDNTVTSAFLVHNPLGRVAVRHCQMTGDGNGINAYGRGIVDLTETFFNPTSNNRVGITLGTTSHQIAPNLNMSRVFLHFPSGSGQTHLYSIGQNQINVSGFRSQGTGNGWFIDGQCTIKSTGCVKTTGCNSPAFSVAASHGAVGGCYISLAGGHTFQSGNYAMQVSGHHFVAIPSSGFLELDGTTNGLIVKNGGRVCVTSSSTITGGTADIVLDGTTTTLTALRALTPKVMSGSYGSYLQEGLV